MTCSNCGTENRPGRKFCSRCGAALAVTCPACGAANQPEDRFCGDCGATLRSAGDERAGVSGPRPDVGPPVSERRLVSVLFADLVGFTTLSESRDPDDVRELLSRYFDTCRQLVSRYGGTVEKFIGDAVMAVWGTPTAQEDDAERAVRTSLDLVQAISALGAEVGAPELKARAGVLTGQAAVNLQAAGEGMVAGDLVNTASRIQAAAQPGTVLVGDTTHRATEAAVVYEDAGSHELKGKTEPVRLWRALRVVGGRGGALKSPGLEAPFVGRDRDLRVIKEAFHASAEERKAHQVSVIGIAGIGKSRLSWEFFKYIDGLSGTAFWHRGRCLSYGDGVTYWALAEMLRGRFGILEGEDPAAASVKLKGALADLLPDPEERAWIEPRLAHLLGLEDRTAPDARDLFSAWRVFFERLAERNPVILVVEDMQWADPSLVEFVEYLMSWSRHHPIFVLALGRPEVAERHPFLVAGTRGVTTLYLEPLAPAAMEELVDGLVPGLPATTRQQMLARAEGVPLYAIETVRMLLDRGLLVEDGPAYRLTGPVEALEVPETLHALIAARLDGLPTVERVLTQDAAVLGKSFPLPALAAVTGRGEAELQPLLDSLVRKEIFGVQADPRSPERGQYGFLQDLVRTVAYDTLSRKDRKARHLAAAAHLSEAWGAGEDEVVEVIASHYVEAWRAAPDAPDAADIRASGVAALTQAGDRSSSLAASAEALRYFEQALELIDDPLEAAELHHRAGDMAWRIADFKGAREHDEAAAQGFEQAGQGRSAAKALASLGGLDYQEGELERGAERLRGAYEAMRDLHDADFAEVAAEFARLLLFTGHNEECLPIIDEALAAAERERTLMVLGHALNTKGIMLVDRGRTEEATALLEHALAMSEREGLSDVVLRSTNNLSAFMERWDRYAEALRLAASGLDVATRLGHASWRWKFVAGHVGPLVWMGRWDEADRFGRELIDSDVVVELFDVELLPLVWVAIARGDVARAAEILRRLEGSKQEEIQVRAALSGATAAFLRAQGKPREALEAAQEGIEIRRSLGTQDMPSRLALIEGVEAAMDLGDLDEAERLLAVAVAASPGDRSPMLEANRGRLEARLLVARGGDHRQIERLFRAAEEGFAALGSSAWEAGSAAEHGEWLSAQGRAEDAVSLLSSAMSEFERLRATPWVARVSRALGGGATAVNAAQAAPA